MAVGGTGAEAGPTRAVIEKFFSSPFHPWYKKRMLTQAIRTCHPLKSTILIIAAALFTLLLSNSVSAAGAEPEHLRESASHILENVIRGVFEGDFGLYARDFSPAMKKTQDRETFLRLQSKLQRALGKLKSIEYLGSYRQLGEIITLFKGRFSKEKNDVLIKLVLQDHQGNFKATGLWFDAPSLEKWYRLGLNAVDQPVTVGEGLTATMDGFEE
jgi:hypothetical protein